VILNTVTQKGDEKVVPKVHLLWLRDFIHNSSTEKFTPILEPLELLLSSSILGETSSGSESFEKFSLAFEQLRWNSKFLHDGRTTAKLPIFESFSSWFSGIYSGNTLTEYSLLINGECEKVDNNTRFHPNNNKKNGDFSLLSYLPKKGSKCGLAPIRMKGFDSFQWVPMTRSGEPVILSERHGIFTFSS
jgi:hypothetical protein